MDHTWYLSVDMQLYILSPLILLPIARYGRKFAYIFLSVITIATIGVNVLLFVLYEMELYVSYHTKYLSFSGIFQ